MQNQDITAQASRLLAQAGTEAQAAGLADSFSSALLYAAALAGAVRDHRTEALGRAIAQSGMLGLALSAAVEQVQPTQGHMIVDTSAGQAGDGKIADVMRIALVWQDLAIALSDRHGLDIVMSGLLSAYASLVLHAGCYQSTIDGLEAWLPDLRQRAALQGQPAGRA